MNPDPDVSSVPTDLQTMQKIVDQVRASFDTAGFFYIVMSPVWEKGIHKFGIAKIMRDRLKQYDSYTPGVVFVKKLYICKDRLAIENAVKLYVGQYLLPKKLEWVNLPLDEICKIFESVTEIDPAFEGQVSIPVYRLSFGKLQSALDFAVKNVNDGLAVSKTFHRFMNTIQHRFEKINRIQNKDKIDIETDKIENKETEKIIMVPKTLNPRKPKINYFKFETTVEPSLELNSKHNQPNIFKRLNYLKNV